MITHGGGKPQSPSETASHPILPALPRTLSQFVPLAPFFPPNFLPFWLMTGHFWPPSFCNLIPNIALLRRRGSERGREERKRTHSDAVRAPAAFEDDG